MDFVTSYPIWRALSADIFTGQIIASLIVLVFLGIFLLREWIIQNARPGVFQDEDIPDAEVQDGVEPDVEHAPEGMPVPPIPEQRREDNRLDEPVRDPADKGITSEHPVIDDNSESVAEGTQSPPRRKRRLDPLELNGDKEFHDLRVRARRTRISAESTGSKSEIQATQDGNSANAAEESPSGFKFTFTVDRAASSGFDPSPRRATFESPPDRAELLGYEPSTPFPFPPRESTKTKAEPRAMRSASSDEFSGSDLPEFIEGSTRSSQAISSVDHAPPKEPFPRLNGASLKAPEPSDADSLSSSSESRTDAYDDEDSDGSNRESISSSMATVADSTFQEDLDEYFPEINRIEGEREGPMRVEEVLEEGPLFRNGQGVALIAEDQELEDAADDQDGINDDDVDNALEGQ